jgi:hypothetical protein
MSVKPILKLILEFMKTKSLMMIAALAVLSFSSCKKDSSSGAIDQTSINLADDDAVADVVFEDVFNTADNATIILDQAGKSFDAKSETVVTDSCPLITITRPTGSLWPKTVVVDYGTSCTGINDNVRSGKILIEVTGPRLQPGSKRTVTFVNYFFNGIKVEGTKVLENKGYNSSQNLVISVKLTDGKLTLPNGKTIERSMDHQREWTAGLLTKNIWDDECLITGTATGKNIDGIAYTNTITTALHWTRACRFIVSGVVNIERDGKDPVQIDYGSGDCDAKASVIRDGVSTEILLKNKHRSMFN